MRADDFLLTYVWVTLTGLFLVAWRSSRRRKGFEPTPTSDHIFRCESCGFVYTDDPDVDLSRCPQCGRTNRQIDF